VILLLYKKSTCVISYLFVISGVPLGSVVDTSLSSIFINCLDGGIESPLTKILGNTKLGGEVDISAEGDILWRDPHYLEGWTIKNSMKFNKDEGKVLHLG